MTSKVNWVFAPELAQFYSANSFRKHEDGFEYWWCRQDLRWKMACFWSLDRHKEFTDFEMRPTLDDSRCNTYNPDETPDYDESLDDKWDSGELAARTLKECVEGKKEPVATPIKSDGGSSSYYDISIPDWLFDKIYERRYTENCYIKTEELIEVMGSDFDIANIIKCVVRINSLKNGVGKAGNDVTYDANKIAYSANRLKERDKR